MVHSNPHYWDDLPQGPALPGTEVERLRAWAEDEQRKRHSCEDQRTYERSEVARLEAELKRLRAALPDAAWLARRFHDAYEQLAPSFGYETRTETRHFDPTTPNGRLMVAVCGRILEALGQDDH